MRIIILQRVLSLAALIIVAAWTASAQNAAPAAQPNLLSHTLRATNADAAWTELQNANQPPPSPPAWRDTPPAAAEKQKFFLPYIQSLVDRMKDFYTKFPTNAHATDAKLIEFQDLNLMLQWGQTNQQPRFEAAGRTLLTNSTVTGQNHFVTLWLLSQFSPPAKARPLLQEILDGPASPQLKQGAAESLSLLIPKELMGKPLDLQFTAVDGRNVDLAKLKGKVVLLDFWATWCPPCVREVPNVKQTYDQFHPKGFEIVGISLDDDKGRLTQFVADNKMEWPQYFDGLHWQNKIAVRFGIMETPTLWLIDKKGTLRNIKAGEDLSGGVQKLLAE